MATMQVRAVRQVRYSSLSSAIMENINRKYPDYYPYCIYEVTSPTGVMTYAANVNGKWTKFSDQGVYIE